MWRWIKTTLCILLRIILCTAVVVYFFANHADRWQKASYGINNLYLLGAAGVFIESFVVLSVECFFLHIRHARKQKRILGKNI